MKNSLKTNLIYHIAYQVAATLLPFISTPYLARVIGASGVGTYSYYHSISLYFVYFAMLGISNYANRAISKNSNDRDKTNKLFSGIYCLQIITSAIVAVAYIAFAFIVTKANIVPVILAIHVLSALFDVSWFYHGLQEFRKTSIVQLFIKILAFISFFTFVKEGSDLWIYTLIMALSYFLPAIILWLGVWKKTSLVRCGKRDIISHVRPCLLLFVPIIATSIYNMMDKVMIGTFRSMTEVGFYESAEKMLLITTSVLGAICIVIMPKISALISSGNTKESNELFKMSTFACMFLAIGISFGIASISNEFIPIFFGDDFIGGIGVSITLCVSLPFLIWSIIVRNLYLIPNEMDRVYVKSVILGAIVNVTLNLILLPVIGVYGAVIGTIIANICLALYQTVPITEHIDIREIIKCNLYFCISGIVMAVVVRMINVIIDEKIIGLAVSVIVGVIVYTVISYLIMRIAARKVLLSFWNELYAKRKTLAIDSDYKIDETANIVYNSDKKKRRGCK